MKFCFKVASNDLLLEMKMIGSHDSNQRGFIIKIMFCINVCFFCEHETANTKIAFVCGHITCHLKLVKLHEFFSLGSFSYENAFLTHVPSSINLGKSFRLHATRTKGNLDQVICIYQNYKSSTDNPKN